MSTENLEVPEVVPEILEAPVAPAPAPVELPERRHEYQPTDEQGRPLGGKQVIKYRTSEELADKLVAQNVELIRKLRSVTKEHRLGISPQDNIPDDAERFEGAVEFRPKELSAQERFEISQQLNDPEKFVDARDRLLESAVGVNPTKLTQVLSDQQLYIMQSRARDNYQDFVKQSSASGYVDSMDNRETITNWMLKNRLAPTVKNFALANSKLREAGLLFETPVVQQEPTPAPAPAAVPAPAPVDSVTNPQSPTAEPSRITGTPQSQVKRPDHVPSGLNERVSSSNGVSTPAGDGLSLTLAQIEDLPSEKYKKLVRNPEFAKHVNALEAEAAKRRAARAQQI